MFQPRFERFRVLFEFTKGLLLVLNVNETFPSSFFLLDAIRDDVKCIKSEIGSISSKLRTLETFAAEIEGQSSNRFLTGLNNRPSV